MVVAVGVFVAVEPVESFDRRTVGLRVAVDRIAVERVGDRHPLAALLLQVHRCDVVVVVVGPAAVAAVLVELADQEGIFAAVVERVENRHAVDCQCDGSPQKPVFRRNRVGCRHRLERNLPGVVADILLGQRHLLLPRPNADHQRMIGYAVRLNEEISVVAADGDRLQIDEGLEGLGDIGGVRPLGLGVGREQEARGDGRRSFLLNRVVVVTPMPVPRMGHRRV